MHFFLSTLCWHYSLRFSNFFTVEQKNIGSLSFLDVKGFCNNGKYVTSVCSENQNSVQFLPIMKVSFQRTKRGDFYMHYCIAYVVISRHSILKLNIWRLSSCKTIIPKVSLIRVLNHFLINYMHLKLLLRIYLEEMFLLSCHSWEVLLFKFERSFKNYLVINWRLLI